jgi:rod shape-determining protein MreD
MIGGPGWPFWVFIALLAIAHFILHIALGLGLEAPNLLTVAVLLAARRTTGAVAAAIGLVLGLLQDALSLVAFGAEAVTLTILGYLGARSRDLFVGDTLAFVGAYLFIGTWLHDIIFFFLAGPAARGDAVVRYLILAPLSAVYSAVAGVIALVLYRLVTGDR